LGSGGRGNESSGTIVGREFFSLAERLLASQEGLCSMELIGWLVG